MFIVDEQRIINLSGVSMLKKATYCRNNIYSWIIEVYGNNGIIEVMSYNAEQERDDVYDKISTMIFRTDVSMDIRKR